MNVAPRFGVLPRAALVAAWTGLITALGTAPATAGEAAWPKAAVEAWEAHSTGAYDSAIDGYRDAIDGGDFRPELPFNLGEAIFRKAIADAEAAAAAGGQTAVPSPGGRGAAGAATPPGSGPDPTLLDAALESFDRAAGSGDAGLRARALTNAGTLRATRGEVDEAKELFKEALRLDPADMRARYNLEFLMSQPPPAEGDSTASDPDGEPSENEEPSEGENSPNDAPPDSSGSQPPDPSDGESQEDEPPPDPSESSPPDSSASEPPPQPETSDAEPTLSPEEARRELDRLEELERELLKALLAAKRRRSDVEKDW